MTDEEAFEAAVTTVISGGRISAIHVIANPDKLQGLGAGRTLSR